MWSAPSWFSVRLGLGHEVGQSLLDVRNLAVMLHTMEDVRIGRYLLQHCSSRFGAIACLACSSFFTVVTLGWGAKHAACASKDGISLLKYGMPYYTNTI
jgi:hypothetical protein